METGGDRVESVLGGHLAAVVKMDSKLRRGCVTSFQFRLKYKCAKMYVFPVSITTRGHAKLLNYLELVCPSLSSRQIPSINLCALRSILIYRRLTSQAAKMQGGKIVNDTILMVAQLRTAYRWWLDDISFNKSERYHTSQSFTL